ncbi:MAG: CDP-alcohol phosphatidyltransferase family protein [Gemmatimonadales bacterium]
MDPERQTILPEPLKNFVLGLLDPVADALIRVGLRPNGITTISVLVLIGSGAAFAMGELRWGAAILLCSGILDLLDGKVARRGGMESRFGAFYDSTMDRVGDAALFMGIGIHFVVTPGQRWPILGLMLCFGNLMTSFLVSYARARAEGLGISAAVGIAQRAERIVLIGVPVLIWHAGPGGWMLLGILAFLFATSGITAVQRVLHVYHQIGGELRPAASPARSAPSVIPNPVVKGT